MRLVSHVQGLGDFREAIAGMVAGRDIEKLTSGIMSVQNQLVAVIEDRNAVAGGYRQAKALYDEAASSDVGDIEPFMAALESARVGVQIFARQIQTLAELDIVFSKVGDALLEAGLSNDLDSVNQTIRQIRRFSGETDQFMADIPEYGQTKRSIIALFREELAASGVSQNDYANPLWFVAYVRGAQRAVPIANQPSLPGDLEASLSGLGAIPVLVVAILWIIAIVAATTVAIATISRIIPDQNSKAKTARDLLLKRNDQKEALRQQLYAQGWDQAAIDKAMKSFDDETQRMTENIPEPGSVLGPLLVPLGVGVMALVVLKALKVI